MENARTLLGFLWMMVRHPTRVGFVLGCARREVAKWLRDGREGSEEHRLMVERALRPEPSAASAQWYEEDEPMDQCEECGEFTLRAPRCPGCGATQ